jgi:hypothetical protein
MDDEIGAPKVFDARGWKLACAAWHVRVSEDRDH